MKNSLFFYKITYLILFLFFLNIKNLFTIESAALNMGLAECIGVYKQLKIINLLDNESSNILISLERKIRNIIDLDQLKKYEEIGSNKIKNININNELYKITDILLGCKNLKSHLRWFNNYAQQVREEYEI